MGGMISGNDIVSPASYNITDAIPLTSGFYTATTARAAVPESVKKRGLELMYEIANGVWITERFIGTSIAAWTTAANWLRYNMLNEFGGQMLPLINKTGAPSVKGSVVSLSLTTDNAFALQSNEYDAIGVVYEGGVADGQECLVVVNGVAQVLLENNTVATRGYWVYSSAVDGRANASLALPPGGTISALENHFKEIGHCMESKAAGTNVLAKCIIHFN